MKKLCENFLKILKKGRNIYPGPLNVIILNVIISLVHTRQWPWLPVVRRPWQG